MLHGPTHCRGQGHFQHECSKNRNRRPVFRYPRRGCRRSRRTHRTALPGLPAPNRYRMPPGRRHCPRHLASHSPRQGRCPDPDLHNGGHQLPLPQRPRRKSFHQSSSTQSRLQRRINDTRRLRLQSIKELQRLQAAQPQPPAPQPASQRAHIESLTSPTGFVPQASRMHSTPEVPPLFPTPENHVSGIDASAPVGASPIGETP